MLIFAEVEDIIEDLDSEKSYGFDSINVKNHKNGQIPNFTDYIEYIFIMFRE